MKAKLLVNSGRSNIAFILFIKMFAALLSNIGALENLKLDSFKNYNYVYFTVGMRANEHDYFNAWFNCYYVEILKYAISASFGCGHSA